LVIWDQMTEAGYEALRRVLEERRVAMQLVSVPFYLLHGARIAEGTGLPHVLLPVRAANIDTPSWAMRISSKMQQMMLGAGKLGYRPLTPQHVRSTADQFSF
jgi:hypothetical protein